MTMKDMGKYNTTVSPSAVPFRNMGYSKQIFPRDLVVMLLERMKQIGKSVETSASAVYRKLNDFTIKVNKITIFSR